MTTNKGKIFGIGLSKTGTTSLANALQMLGYETKDNMGVVEYATGDLASVDLETVRAFDALTDTPIPSFYRELDAHFPGSKFILTVRDSEGWLKSCKKQFTQRFAEIQTDAHKRLFMDLYATDVFDEQRFASGYKQFVTAVGDYFRHRPDDLLIIDVAAGEGWEKLCPFLGRAIPDLPFPKANVTQVRWMGIDEVVAVARQAGLELMQHYDGDNVEGATGIAKKLVARVVRTVLGEDATQAAARAAHKVAIVGLTKLNSHIPVQSRLGDIVPYAERRQWNHQWLVDPLDGEAAFSNGVADFSVNIALIEDGRPIYGVVYAPAIDTTYYARAGKDAYKRVGLEEPISLSPNGGATQAAARAARMQAPDVSTRRAGPVSSQALAMCTLAEKDNDEHRALIASPSMEWDVAAAHVILNAAGMRVLEGDSGNEVSYNNKDMSIPPFRVE